VADTRSVDRNTSAMIKRVALLDENLLIRKVQQRARGVAYAGQLGMSFHDFSSTKTVFPDHPNSKEQEAEEVADEVSDAIILQATWSFSYPCLREPEPTDRNTVGGRRRIFESEWAGRIAHAMVDGVVGWVHGDDERRAGIPFWRALKERGLVYDQEGYPTENGSSGTFRFRSWGGDEAGVGEGADGDGVTNGAPRLQSQ